MIAVFGKKRLADQEILKYLIKHFSKKQDVLRKPIVAYLEAAEMRLIISAINPEERLKQSDLLLLVLLIERAGGVVEHEAKSEPSKPDGA